MHCSCQGRLPRWPFSKSHAQHRLLLAGQAGGTLMSVLGRPASCQLRIGSVDLSSAAPRYAMLWSSRKMRQSRSVMSSRAFSDQCEPTCSMQPVCGQPLQLLCQRPCAACTDTAVQPSSLQHEQQFVHIQPSFRCNVLASGTMTAALQCCNDDKAARSLTPLLEQSESVLRRAGRAFMLDLS